MLKLIKTHFTELFSCNKEIRQGDGLSPVLFSLFMNALPKYFKENKCPGVMLGNQSLNCLVYADNLLVISPSPEGFQQSAKKLISTFPFFMLYILSHFAICYFILLSFLCCQSIYYT